MSADALPSEKLRAAVEAVLPGVTAYVERTVPFGEARVWSVHEGDRVVAWLKRHRHKDKARRERRAYRTWLPGLSGTPRLLLAPEDLPASLLFEHVPGERADQATLTAAEELEVFRQLGRFLAALHAVPVDTTDELPLEEALPERCEAWTERAAGIVDDDLIDAVREMFAAPLPPGLVRVPCHRDLQLHNVMVERTTDGLVVRVLDFGQSRADCWLADLVKLFQLPEEVSPGLFRALLEGYGRRLGRGEAEVLVRLRALHGLATWVWSADHGDRRGLRLGRRILEHALDAWTPEDLRGASAVGHPGAGSGEEA
ncbi:MAG: aminoglycoside phosphotransferase family protein [Alphaproteobacteria bacterium]|nr:aminoglycoside phosphotransferase family protein [Alphaproteobacteria bacterium]